MVSRAGCWPHYCTAQAEGGVDHSTLKDESTGNTDVAGAWLPTHTLWGRQQGNMNTDRMPDNLMQRKELLSEVLHLQLIVSSAIHTL